MDDARHRWLESHGYRITCRRAGWAECLLSRGDGERWLGSGGDEAEAFANALRLALPSAAAMLAFDQAVAGMTPPSVDPAPSGAPPTELLPIDPPPTPIAGATAIEPARATVGECAAPAGTPAEPALPTAIPVAMPSTAPIPREVMTIGAAHVELDDLQRVMHDTYVEAPLLAPARQRLLLTQWMARGRAIAEAVGRESSVAERVHRLAQGLARLAKAWWPGSVQVLTWQTSPWSCTRDFDPDLAVGLRTWRDVEDAASVCLDRLEAGAAGCDDFGWHDAPALTPPPADPAAMFEGIRAAIEAHSQPSLMRAQSAVHADELRPSITAPPQAAHATNWSELAAGLRWLRGVAPDAELWGAAMGRMRWLAQFHEAASVARPLLDPTFTPRGSWRHHVGIDRRELQRRHDDVMARVPGPADDPTLVAWLLEAFELGSSLSGEQLAAHVLHLREGITALREEAFAERKQRRRLRDLKARLQAGGIAAAPPAEPRTTAPAAAATAADAPTTASGDELRAARLRPFTEGKRVLFVSNRHDPARDQRLQALLGFAAVDSCVAEPSRVDAKAGAVRSGTYQFVLAATGFLPHKVDHSLKDACRACDVPYVRVNRGRPQQCLLHLARELGIDSQART